jgi:hypothetical protein
MEFFQSLYPEQHIKQFIKNLKGLQEVLGNFQDLAVQENALKLFGEEMLNNHVHANTLLAMGVLIQNLDALRGEARKDFTAKFATFKHEENQSAFKSLLAAKDRYNNPQITRKGNFHDYHKSFATACRNPRNTVVRNRSR